MRKIYVAIMGFGTVGKGTYDSIVAAHDKIIEREGIDVEVKRVVDVSERKFALLPSGVGTTSVDDVVEDKDVSIVVETMGGVEPARTFIKKMFESGKSVVSANKELISKHWEELQDCAQKNGVGFYFEASCVGAVPVIRALNESVNSDNVLAIYGIVNGTTNYILTKMTKEGMEYSDALKEAQQLGYAEANPEADVEGYDAGYKLSILSTMAYGKRVFFQKEACHGISTLTKEDITYAKIAGYKIRLIAESRAEGDAVSFVVHPVCVKNTHMLSKVFGVMNAVYLCCDNAGDMMLFGSGAGSRPTGSAILSDVVYCAKRQNHIYYNLKEKARAGKGVFASARFAVIENYDEEEYQRIFGDFVHEKIEFNDKVILVTEPLLGEHWNNLLLCLKTMKIVRQFKALL